MAASLMLEGKHAVVFGGGGSIGAAVAKELATEGAEVFLGGRTSASVEAAASLAESTMLKTSPRTSDTAKAAAFLASDRARMMTGTVLNSSAGAATD
jgi:NAD(P)-dependent dehydrogenase (short-subunit alcohol dehydrogenase family)